MLRGLFKKTVGEANPREIARLQKVVERINALEPAFETLDDTQLQAKTGEFRQRLAEGETLDDLLVEAFAAVREAAKRTIGLRHYDVQLIGGIALHQGHIAEMKTGEGKTLVATLPLYLNALAGKGAHLVTPNDYLSKVGVQWMGPIYHALGLPVGVIQSAAADPNRGSFIFDPDYPSADDRFLNLRPVSRREAYRADITYGTNNEFGFDYLRDNMVRDLSECVQRELTYAIIDEVDNILIDEARTPLIISGPAEESSELYGRFADVARRLRPSSPESVEQEEPDGDYVLEERTQVVTLTEHGVERVEQMLPEVGAEESIYDTKHAHMLPYLDNALRATVVYKRDKDYIVKDGEVIIVDQFTGRLMYGRRFSEGLHQAIEATEGVEVRRESLTYATVTFQNYFRMYEKLAGMTGTAKTEEEEFRQIYDLDVAVLPTNVEYRATYGDRVYGDLVTRERRTDEIEEVTFAGVLDGQANALGELNRSVIVTTYEPADGDTDGRRYFKRLDLPDVIHSTERAKFRAVVAEIGASHQAGRPVLVGTIAIETSERLSRMLKRQGIPHQVLNAKYHEKEAVIIAQAGRSGAVTIATNMAGRGVDIKLGGDSEGIARERLRREGFDLTQIPQAGWNHAQELLRQTQDATKVYPERWAEVLAEAVADCAADQTRVVASGGLHILGTERHEARRIDNQLRGRAGRQGDPGSSRFYISLEDELMRRFGGERVQGLMGRLGVEEDVPIQHAWLDKSIESAQMRVEGYNFDIRKHVLEYDDVVNKQREVIYTQRRQVLSAPDLREQVLRMVRDEISPVVATHTPGPDPDDWDLRGLYSELRTFFPLPPDFNYHRWRELGPGEIETQLSEVAERAYDEVNRSIGRQVYRQAAREDVTPGGLAQSVDPAKRLAYQRVVERLGREPDEEMLVQPLRRLPDQTKAQIEAAFVDAYRLFRDRQLMLRAVDGLWVRHLTNLEALREGIGLRAYGQQNPLVAYRKEAHEMYEALLARVQETVARSVYLVPQALVTQPRRQRLQATHPGTPAEGRRVRQVQDTPDQAPGRNDPCWCGSGKKYKHCHMRQDMESQRGPVTAARPPQAPERKRRRRRH
ncbi:MAG TPA: preprotein translocase subunit SecA [Anaerolineae bacterium]|nr:preprotein translocase subunit SecA [Anaerolineae bacterium]